MPQVTRSEGYSDDTEILTETNGWRRFADLTPGERVATRTPAGEFEWQDPVAYTAGPASGNLIRFYSRSLDVLVAPGHRMLVENTYGVVAFMRASDLVRHARGVTYKIPATSRWLADDVETFWIDGATEVPAGLCGCGCGEPVGTLRTTGAPCSVDGCNSPDRTWGLCTSHYQRWRRWGDPLGGGPYYPRPSSTLPPSRFIRDHGHGKITEPLGIGGDHFAAFFGAWVAEGCLNKNQIIICQMPGSRGFEAYGAMLAEMVPTGVRHDGRKYLFINVRLANYLRQFGHAPDKFVPQEVKDYSAHQLRLLWDNYILGDGDAEGRRAFTTSKRLADDLQEIAQKIGMWANVKDDSARKYRYRTFVGDREILAENKRDSYLVNYRAQTGHVWVFDTEEVPYEGRVSCVTVPNGTLYVRRNGKAIWCGGSA